MPHRQLPLSQEHADTSLVSHVLLRAKLLWCSRTAFIVPGIHIPAQSWAKQPQSCSGALVHRRGPVPSHTRPGSSKVWRCPAMQQRCTRVHLSPEAATVGVTKTCFDHRSWKHLIFTAEVNNDAWCLQTVVGPDILCGEQLGFERTQCECHHNMREDMSCPPSSKLDLHISPSNQGTSSPCRQRRWPQPARGAQQFCEG